ncbi:MAG: tetratricopeptide repeat protein, partial [Desulfobacterales bacterium]
DMARAAEHFRQAAELSPENQIFLLNAGVGLYGQGRYREAIPYFRRALAVQPDFAEAHFNLANAFSNSGDPEAALTSYREALTCRPDFPAARSNMVATLSALGLAHYQGGRLHEAEECLRQAIAGNPDHLDAINNLGLVYNDTHRPTEAVDCYRKCLDLNPNHPQVSFNLGLALGNLGHRREAAEAYRQALALRPDYTEAMNNLAHTCRLLGQLDEAEALLKKITQSKPDEAVAHFNLSNLYLARNQGAAAFSCCRRATALDPHNLDFWQQMVLCFQQIRVDLSEVAMVEADLHACLAMEGIYRDPLVPLAIDILKHRPAFMKVLGKVRAGSLKVDGADGSVLALITSDLLLLLLSTASLTDPDVEETLTAIRRSLLLNVVRDEGTAPAGALLAFAIALARQCFMNEYVFFQTQEERDALHRLHEALENDLALSRSLNPFAVVVAAAHAPLHRVKGVERLRGCYGLPPALLPLLVQQVEEPLAEIELRGAIPSVAAIEDRVSREVLLHYEQNPYPRWKDLPLTGSAASFTAKLRTTLPSLSLEGLTLPSTPEILVAGCGTGREAIQTSKIYSGARILAVDLSLASLAYAKRKAGQYQAANIDFVQGDILTLSSLDRRFDLIECSGVLHHLRDPRAGWQVLLGLLKPQGFMKIALYSELARQPVVAVRNLIARKGYQPTPQEIRECRQEIFRLPPDDPARKIVILKDFYTMSECRDLIFHGMEHRFTIPQLRDIIAGLGLVFLGFTFNEPAVMNGYRRRFSDDVNGLSLENWHQYEQENPDTFAGMYTFWLRRA